MSVLQVGDDALKTVLLSPSLNVESLARLACSCTTFRTVLADEIFLRRLVASHGFHRTQLPLPTTKAQEVHDQEEEDRGTTPEFTLSPSAVCSLEELAVLAAVRDNLESNHIVFHYATLKIVDRCKDVLGRYATLMQRHPRLRIRVDAHTGVGAPPSIAPQHSLQRCCVVARELVRQGVSIERIQGCAWGMDVGRKWRWPPKKEFARCEVFLTLTPKDDKVSAEDSANDGEVQVGHCIPLWPQYYTSIRPRCASIPRNVLAGDDSDEESDSDDGSDEDSSSSSSSSEDDGEKGNSGRFDASNHGADAGSSSRDERQERR